MLLTAAGVLAVVTTTLAFNSDSFGCTAYCGTVQNAIANTTACPLLVNRSYEQSAVGNRWCTTDPDGTCSTRANVVVCQ
jgi:hypothetical protein